MGFSPVVIRTSSCPTCCIERRSVPVIANAHQDGHAQTGDAAHPRLLVGRNTLRWSLPVFVFRDMKCTHGHRVPLDSYSMVSTPNDCGPARVSSLVHAPVGFQIANAAPVSTGGGRRRPDAARETDDAHGHHLLVRERES